MDFLDLFAGIGGVSKQTNFGASLAKGSKPSGTLV